MSSSQATTRKSRAQPSQPLPNPMTDDEAALADLYTRLGPVAYGLAIGIVRDAAAAEEIVCAAFLEAWIESSPSPDGVARNNLLAAVHRRAAEYVRGSYPRPEHRVPQPGVLPGWLALKQETAWGLLSQLPDHEREVIELAYFGCYTLTEIATRLDLPVKTVNAHLSGALDQLGELQQEPAYSRALRVS